MGVGKLGADDWPDLYIRVSYSGTPYARVRRCCVFVLRMGSCVCCLSDRVPRSWAEQVGLRGHPPQVHWCAGRHCVCQLLHPRGSLLCRRLRPLCRPPPHAHRNDPRPLGNRIHLRRLQRRERCPPPPPAGKNTFSPPKKKKKKKKKKK